MAPEKVELHLYDLSNGLAAQLSLQLTGKYIPAIWHSTIVVFGTEVYYGQGIQRCQPGRSHHGRALKIVQLGETHIDKETFEDYLHSMQDMYSADKYHLLEWNCNSFTNDVAGFLTGGQIPQEVIDLPKEFLSTPFGMALRPQIDAMFRRSADPSSATSSQLPSGPNGAASALMNHVARTVQEPTPARAPTNVTNGAIHGEETLASSLTIATNMASFNSILSSTRCVCVMFTADWCGPCKVIKPVFEELAKRSPNEPPMTFVLVDTTAGREIAGHYNVSAVPTIKFFLDSRQQHEIKGADVGELKTQVQLLAMAAFPNHQHTKLKLPTLRSLSDSPVLYEQKPNFSAALAKLETFKTNDKLNQLIDRTKPHLKSLAEPSKLSQEQIITIFKDVHELLEVLPPQQCFPVLDVLKYAVLQPQIAELAAESLNTESNVVLAVLSLGDQPSESFARPTQLTLLRLLCNCFSSAIVASRLLSETKSRSKVTSILVQGLLQENNTVRVVAGSLAFNTATYLRKERRTWVDATDSQQEDYQEREDFEIELCSALLEALEREDTLDVAHRLLASLGQLLLFSPHFENGLKPLLEALEAKRIVQSKKNILEKNVEAVKLVREVSELVESE